MICGPRAAISPASPCGTGVAASSRQATSVEGTGTPIEPARVLPKGLKVSTGEVSVRP
jgi:hypothetical protein